MKTTYSLSAGLTALACAAAAHAAGPLSQHSPLERDPAMRAAIRSEPPQPLYTTSQAVTVMNSGSTSIATAAAGYTALDAPRELKCAGPNRCIISAEQHVQFSGATDGSNYFAICSYVNGHSMGFPPCPYLGLLPADGSYTAGNFAQSYQPVKPGTYRVSTDVYTSEAATADYYQITYHVYNLPN